MASLSDSLKSIDRLTRDFTGREWVFAEIERWLEDTGAARFFILTGEPGVGKSALAARVVQQRSAAAHHFCIARSADTIDPLNFARSLAEQLSAIDGFARLLLQEKIEAIELQQDIRQNYGQVIGIQIEKLVIQAPSAALAFSQAVVGPLKALYAGGYDRKLLIVVDGLDEAAQYSGPETIVDLLANAGGLPEGVRLLVTTRPEKGVLRHFEHLQTPPWLLDASGSDNQKDARRYIEQKLASLDGLEPWLQQHRKDRTDLVYRLVEVSQGNFLYLAWLLPAISQNLDRLDLRQDLPPGLDGIYREFLMTRKPGKDPDAWEKRYRPVAGLLAAAQAPLSFEQLLWLSRLKKQDLRDVLRDLNQFLDPSGSARGEYQLYHQSLTDFFSDESRSQDFWIDLPDVHQEIARRYLQRSAPAWAGCDSYGFKNLPAHLAKGGLLDELRQLLGDLSWLEAKLKATHILDLLSDFDLLPGEEGLARLQAALRLSIEALAIDKDRLWEQLYGRTLLLEPPLPAVSQAPARPWLRTLTPSLEQVGGALVRTLAAHTGPVHSVALAPSGKLAVSASYDKTLKVWDLGSGTVLRTLEGHQESADLVIISNDRQVISASWWENVLRVWQLDTGTLLHTLKVPGKGVGALAMDNDGRLAAAYRYSDKVTLWDLETQARIKDLKVDVEWITSLLFIPDRDWLAVGGRSQVGVWDIGQGVKLFEIDHTAFELEITSLAATLDGRWLAFSAGLSLFSGNTWIFPNSSSIRVVELEDRSKEMLLSGHSGAITAIAFTPDGKTLVSAGKSTPTPPMDNTIKVWDLPAGECAATLEGHAEAVNCLAVSQDGKRAVSASSDRTLKVWDLEAARRPRPGRAHAGRINAAAITADGSLAVTAGEEGAIKVWDLPSQALLFDLKGEVSISALAISADGRRAVSCGNEYAIVYGSSVFTTNLQAWELQPQSEPLTLVRQIEGLRTDWFTAAAVLPGGRQALVAKQADEYPGKPADFRLWDLVDGKSLTKWENGGETVHQLVVLPGGRWFVSVSGFLKLWSLEEGEHTSRQLSDRPASAAALSPDGTRLASGGWKGMITVWDVDTWTPQVEFPAQPSGIQGIAWALGGRALVSAGRDRSLAVWDLETTSKQATFIGESPLSCLAAAPDGVTILAGEESGRLHFLRLQG